MILMPKAQSIRPKTVVIDNIHSIMDVGFLNRPHRKKLFII